MLRCWESQPRSSRDAATDQQTDQRPQCWFEFLQYKASSSPATRRPIQVPGDNTGSWKTQPPEWLSGERLNETWKGHYSRSPPVYTSNNCIHTCSSLYFVLCCDQVLVSKGSEGAVSAESGFSEGSQLQRTSTVPQSRSILKYKEGRSAP